MAEVQSDVFRGASVTEASEMVSSVVPTIAWAGWPRHVALVDKPSRAGTSQLSHVQAPLRVGYR